MPEPGKRLELRDDDELGLIFRVTDTGRRSWSVRYRNQAGEHRRKSIGPYPAIGLARAREEARKIKGAVATGTDLVADARLKKAEAAARRLRTFEGLAEAYFEDAALGLHRTNARGPKRASTITEERRIFDKHIRKPFGALPVAEIKRADIQSLVTKLTRQATSNGRHARNVIRQLMSYALAKDLIEANPAHDIAVIVPQARERSFTDDELRLIWSASIAPADHPGVQLSLDMGAAIRMAMLTLQRGGEVIGMHWREIDLERRLWTIPADRMKGKRTHLVPLSEPALSILDALGERSGRSGFVFKSEANPDRPMTRAALTRALKRMSKALGIEDARTHDFRRTGATNLTGERIGIPRFIVSQVLAHSGDTGGSAAVTGRHYDLNDYLADKRRALEAWAALLLTIVGEVGQAKNVVLMNVQSIGSRV
ncbi:MAG: site-specific integrase [Oricola sp.]|nr:MAG: site-specific integrase [Oricola sp.]